MSKQNKGLAGFGKVANDKRDNVEKEIDIRANEIVEPVIDPKQESEVNQEENVPAANSLPDVLDFIKKKPKENKRQICIYVDEDTAKKLDKFAKEYGKGAKSELINNLLKSVLK